MEHVVELYDKLLFICKTVTDGHELTDDLRQEVTLYLLEMDKEYVNKLHEENRLERYATTIAFRKWYFGNGSKEVGQKNNACFRYVFRDFNFIAGVSLDDVMYLLESNSGSYEDQIQDLYKEVTEPLEPFEREVLKEYVRRNCKVSQYAKDVGLSRQQLQKRIEYIKQKIKDNVR